jgi:hypothetical protein
LSVLRPIIPQDPRKRVRQSIPDGTVACGVERIQESCPELHSQLDRAVLCCGVLCCAVLSRAVLSFTFHPHLSLCTLTCPMLFTSMGSLCFFPHSSMAPAPGIHAAVNDCSGKTQTHTFDCIPGKFTHMHMHNHMQMYS